MKAKVFFQRVRAAESELKVLHAKEAHYHDLGLSMSANMSGMPGHAVKGTSRVELAAIGAVDVFQSIREQERELGAIIAQAEWVIKNISQERYRQILNYRYLCGWSFRSISDELEYSDPNSVYRAHGWALREAQIILNRMEANNDLRGNSEEKQ